MKNWMKEENIHLTPHRKVQFFLLLAVGVVEALFIATEGMFHYIGYYITENYIAIPCFLFLGTILNQKLTAAAKQNLGLSCIAVIWFVLVQIQHRSQGIEAVYGGYFFLSYLMAFPFASVMEDQGKNIGMKLVTTLFLLTSLVLVGYSALLVLGWLPDGMQNFVVWDGTRLSPLWHPNVTASIFMIGIGVSLSYLFHTKKNWKKGLLAASAAVLFLAISLTNCRTSVLFTCVLVGGAVFFAIYKGGRKRLMAGTAAALVTMAVLFAAASGIYEWNQELHVKKVTQQMQEVPEETRSAPSDVPTEYHEEEKLTAPQPDAMIPPETEEFVRNEDQIYREIQGIEGVKQEIRQYEKSGIIIIRGNSDQGSFLDDLKTLNGRTKIWRAALDAVGRETMLKWWGTPYVGVMISASGEVKAEHAHNSWVEMLMSLGLPGLVIALVYTGIAFWSAAVLLVKQNVESWKKMIAVLLMCILGAGFLEPFLFFTKSSYQFIDFIFFFILGYLDLWRRQVLHPERFAP